jgi:hypothetical protein
MTTYVDQADWDFLLAERTAIMLDDLTMTEARAKALALGDTIRRFGPRPSQVAA